MECSITWLPVNIQVTLTALLLIVVAVVKDTIDYKGRKLTKAATQRKTCGKNMEVSSPPHAVMYGEQLRKVGENLQQRQSVQQIAFVICKQRLFEVGNLLRFPAFLNI